MNKENYNKIIDNNLTKFDKDTVGDIETIYKDKLENSRKIFIYELPFDLNDKFYSYIEFLLKHIQEINKHDAINIFMEGFKQGIEFERYLKDKYEKSEL